MPCERPGETPTFGGLRPLVRTGIPGLGGYSMNRLLIAAGALLFALIAADVVVTVHRNAATPMAVSEIGRELQQEPELYQLAKTVAIRERRVIESHLLPGQNADD